jgi:C4-dicarboxylate transporter
MNVSKWIEGIARFIAQEPLDKALLSVLCVPLILGLIFLFTHVMRPSILGKRQSPFVRMAEMYAAIITVLVAWVNFTQNPKALTVWIIIAIITVAGGWVSWVFLRWAHEQDRNLDKKKDD